MFRYPRTRALVTWSNSKSQRRNRLLIFRWGKHLSATLFCNRVKRSHHADVSAGPCEHPVRLAPKTMLRPTIRLGCVVGNSTDGTPGFQSLRRFAPDAGGATSPSAGPACRLADCSPRLIFVAGSVVLRGKR
jgi:hypothetical protein